MANSNINITFEVEPIVKLKCANVRCKYNLQDNTAHDDMPYCNLKRISLDEIGSCESQEDKY